MKILKSCHNILIYQLSPYSGLWFSSGGILEAVQRPFLFCWSNVNTNVLSRSAIERVSCLCTLWLKRGWPGRDYFPQKKDYCQGLHLCLRLEYQLLQGPHFAGKLRAGEAIDQGYKVIKWDQNSGLQFVAGCFSPQIFLPHTDIFKAWRFLLIASSFTLVVFFPFHFHSIFSPK